MKEYINKPANLNRIEFWAVTTIYVFSVFFMITAAVRNNVSDIWTPNRFAFEEAKITFNYYRDYFFPNLVRYTVLYLSFLLFNYQVVPGIINKRSIAGNIAASILVFLLIGVVCGITDTYLRGDILYKYPTYEAAYSFLFQNSFVYASWLMLMFAFYSVIKYGGQYLLLNSESIEAKYKIITRDGITAFVLWMISVFVLLIINVPKEIVAVWFVIIPIGILFYWYSFYRFIPDSLRLKKPFLNYLGRITLVLLVSVLPLVLLGYILGFDGPLVTVTILFNSAFQLLITAPLTWVIYKRQQQGKEEMYILKTQLGRSNANFDFLRSQINPHFLFNALNTIYGTALQENAERTSEGIEKLGDMMRFMLQENMQEKISLAREVDYLNNYISLQKLRTDTSPEVTIQAEIEQQVNTLQISPMLLIPFVENAFKHGISLREPSHIKVMLQTKADTLYFDVYNSIHLRSENDPEKNKSGIGLQNVKQRLNHLYPLKHELIIRDTGKEFFVHLTLQLA
ncbi:sensor histidine kinase [Rubrolithibacter danxiaensis]|uniref:sensor histidine kinase n=1 Tax=Rubrolithibacter danxiaensis TaxID=3390805 RepID=UPI003BF8D37C